MIHSTKMVEHSEQFLVGRADKIHRMTAMRHGVAQGAVNLESDERSDSLLIVIFPFFVAGETAIRCATDGAAVLCGCERIRPNLPFPRGSAA